MTVAAVAYCSTLETRSSGLQNLTRRIAAAMA